MNKGDEQQKSELVSFINRTASAPRLCGTSEAAVWAALGSLGHQTTSPERSGQGPGLKAQRMIEIKCVHSTSILLADGAHTVQQSGFRCHKCSLISLCIWLNTQFGLGMSTASLIPRLDFICTIVLLIVMVIKMFFFFWWITVYLLLIWVTVSKAVLETVTYCKTTLFPHWAYFWPRASKWWRKRDTPDCLNNMQCSLTRDMFNTVTTLITTLLIYLSINLKLIF